MLLKAGADPNGALPGGETPLMTASRTGNACGRQDAAGHGASVDAKDDRRGQTALMWAAAEGHAAVVQALIDADANFTRRCPQASRPLLFAVREGRTDVVRVLLQAGADVNEPIPVELRRRGYGGRLPPAGATPLLIAVTNAHYELASLCSTRARTRMPTCPATPCFTPSPRCASRASATTIRRLTVPAA